MVTLEMKGLTMKSLILDAEKTKNSVANAQPSDKRYQRYSKQAI